MNDTKYIFRTKPGIGLISTGIAGVVFWGWIEYIMLSSKWNFKGVDDKTGSVIMFFFMGVLVLFSLLSIWLIVGYKIYLLTENQLIINRPLVFFNQTIELSDIERILGADYTMKINISKSVSNNNPTDVYHGRKAILRLKNGKEMQFTSFEVRGCETLIREINKQLQNLRHSQAHTA